MATPTQHQQLLPADEVKQKYNQDKVQREQEIMTVYKDVTFKNEKQLSKFLTKLSQAQREQAQVVCDDDSLCSFLPGVQKKPPPSKGSGLPLGRAVG